MLFELLEAFQVGKEAGNIIENLYNGDNYNAVVKAYEMAQSLDVNDHYNEGIIEILDQLSVVDDNDRDFVKAATYDLRARCYFELGDYAKARQNITACLNIQIDSFTLEKDSIREHQKAVRELRQEVDMACAPKSLPNCDSSINRGQSEPELEQIQKPVTQKSYSRKELLDIIAKCNNTSAYYVTEDSFLNAYNYDILSRLENWYNITVSKEQLDTAKTYRDLIDCILPNPNLSEAEQKSVSSNNIDIPTESDVKDLLLDILEYRLKIDRGIIQPHDKLDSFIHSNEMWRTILSDFEYAYRYTVDDYKDEDWRSGFTIDLLSIFLCPDTNDKKLWRNKRIQKYMDSKGCPVYGKPLPPWSPFIMNVSNSYILEDGKIVVTGIIQSGEIKNSGTLFTSTPSSVLPISVINVEKQGVSVPLAEEGDFVAITVNSPYGHIVKGMTITSQVPEAKPQNTNIQDSIIQMEQKYLEEVRATLEDGEIGPRERKSLERFAARLGISPSRALELESSLTAPVLTDDEKEYLEEVKQTLEDGEIGPRERKSLDRYASRLGISPDRAKEIEAIAGKK